MCGQGMSGGSMGGPVRLVTRPSLNCLNFVAILFSVVLMIEPRVLFLKAILSTSEAGDFTGGSHAGWV